MKNFENINQYFWLKKSYKKIINYYQNVKNYHSILLHSKIGVGEELLLYNVSIWLMCSQKKNGMICNTCKDCKLMSRNNHPNFHKLIVKENENSIRIEDTRTIINNITNDLSKQIKNIIWITNIELISEKIASLLLPILEEPPKNTFILLNCYNLNSVYLMIRSRCLILDLIPFIRKSDIDFMKKNHSTFVELKTAINLFNGALFMANKILKSEIWKIRLQLCQSIELAIKKKNLFLIFPYLNYGTIKENQILLFWFITILSDSIKWSINTRKNLLLNEDILPLVNTISRNWRIKVLFSQWREWSTILKNIKKVNNINYELLLTSQLLKWETNF